MVNTYDAIVVGAGQAGPGLARTLAGRGWKVALAEGERVGGTCVNFGCTPSKTLVGSARAIHAARRGDEFGFHAGAVTVDFARVMQRQRDLVEGMRGRGERRLEQTEGLTFYRAWAQFESSRRLRVGDEVIESERIYLDVGGRALVPDLEGLDGIPYLDNKTLLDLNELPRHLVIVGGGYVAMEYGQTFRRFGAEVTIIQHGEQVLNREDPDAAEALQGILEKEGVRFLLNAQAKKVEQRGPSVVLHVEQNSQERGIEGSHLLIAAGRRPNTDKLGVEKAGIALDDKGYIKVDDHLKTNVEGIYALGEANGHGPFTHTAYNDYEIAVDNLDGGTRKLSDRITIYGVFTDPPLGRVGMTEREAKASGLNALVGTLPMSDVNRASEFGQTEGFMKVLVDADTQQFLGAALLGLDGDEVAHAIAVLMYAQAPYTVLKNAVHIHPTVTELLPAVLDQLKPLA
jgi:pyruvate/2-oxoglutarate dehydrogenase complex dihydrolipoamide dehydrogenase (E3) component